MYVYYAYLFVHSIPCYTKCAEASKASLIQSAFFYIFAWVGTCTWYGAGHKSHYKSLLVLQRGVWKNAGRS